MEYDYTGVRVKKNASAGITLYPFAGYEIDPNGVITKFVRIGIENYASKKGTNKYFYHNDHLGSVNVITDIASTRVQLNEYDPWGSVSRSEGTIDPTQRFTGQKLDPETGLYYYGGRYYDAEIGRFVSADPFVQTPLDPQNLNRYSYVVNNPQNYIDPDGYFHRHKKKKGGFFRSFFGFFIGGIVAIATGGAGAPAWLAGAIGGFVAGGVSVAGTAGVNPLGSLFGGAFLGGLAGAISPTIFSGLGGNTAAGFSTANFLPAVGSGAITGAITGAIGTGIYGGSFGRNVGFGALGGAGIAAIVYGVGAAWERYWYGKDVTSHPSVQQNLQNYQTRYSNADLAGVRVFEGGASLPEAYGALTADGNNVVLGVGLSDGPSNALANTLGHEFFHVEQFRSIPNFQAVWDSSIAHFGRTFNPFEILANHRGSVFSGMRMSPIYNQFGLPGF